MIQIILSIVELVSAGTIINQIEVGCLVQGQSPCTTLCKQGTEDCSVTPNVCEYGYFLFQSTTCVLCPYQDVNDIFTMYCMDCVEQPYNWDNSRQCSYNYYIGNNDQDEGAYIQQSLTYTELYFVGLSLKPVTTSTLTNRDLTRQYQVFQCSGCASFCTPGSDTTCNSFTNPYAVDSGKTGLKCLAPYYFFQNGCSSCSMQNCIACTSATVCTTCSSGYQPSATGSSCISCQSNCLSCKFTNNKQVCNSCNRSGETYYIESLDRYTCVACGSQCSRCEYITSNGALYYQYPTRQSAQITDVAIQSSYLKRCRQCSGYAMTINYSGINCDTCTIRYCAQCYYIVRNGVTTLDLNFTPLKTGEATPTLQCFRCELGYYWDGVSTCAPIASIPVLSQIANCQTYRLSGAIYTCILCSSGYILDTNNQVCIGQCSTQISNCNYCYAYLLAATTYVNSLGQLKNRASQQQYQCQQCASGYYPDFFSGLCLPCNSGCSTCWQYTMEFNYTSFLQLQQVLTTDTINSYTSYTQLSPYCSSCNTNYQLYGSTCKGCSSNCVISSGLTGAGNLLSNACAFLTSTAFCGQCYDSFTDRSLTPDMTQCHTCPNNCQSCRDRTAAELANINPYFSPTSSSLLKYSRLCYKYNTRVPPSSLTTQSYSYKSYLNLPITCTYTSLVGSTQKCKRTAVVSVNLYCSTSDYNTAYSAATGAEQLYMYDLNAFYNIATDQTATISFPLIETYDTYKALNDQVVEQLTLKINLMQAGFVEASGTLIRLCSFTKTTYISTQLQQNVFSLKTFQIQLIGATSATETKIKLLVEGLLIFNSISDVLIQGVNLIYTQGAGYSTYFGIMINSTQPTNLFIINTSMGRIRSDSVIYNQMQLLFYNIQLCQLTGVNLYNMVTSDRLEFLYSLTSFTKQTIILNGVTFLNLQMQGKQLFRLNSIPTSQIDFQATDLLFESCTFNALTIIGESDSNELNTGTINIQSITFRFCIFNQTSYFINLKSQNSTQISNLKMVQTSFTNSILINSNSFTVNNVYLQYLIFYTGGYLFYTQDRIIDNDANVANSLSIQSFSNMNIAYTTCVQANCLLYIITPTNSYGIISSIQLNNIQIYHTNSTAITQAQSYSVSSSLIYLKNLNQVTVNGFISDNNRGVTILSVVQFQSIIFQNGLYDWTDPTSGPTPTDPYNTSVTPGPQIQYAQNNKIPLVCQSTKIILKSFSQIFLFLGQFSKSILIDTVTIRRQLSLDTSFIQIDSWDLIQFNTTSGNIQESITIKNLKLISNSFTITTGANQISGILINSQQYQNILISNCNFYDNHLHTTIPVTLVAQTPTILINSDSANVIIQQCQFSLNRATASSYAVSYFVVSSLTFLQNTFNQTNILTPEWYSRVEECQLLSSNETQNYRGIKTLFEISTIGGNVYAKSSILNMTYCSFNNGYAKLGAAIYADMIQSGVVYISNSQFNNQITRLDSSIQSTGGAIYIDASGAKMSLTIIQTSMNNCTARSQGGCIYLKPSTIQSTVSITTSSFINCSSLSQSIINLLFSVSSESPPVVTITNSSFISNNMESFLTNIPDISSSEKQLFATTACAIEQTYGYLTISYTSFIQFRYVSIIRATQMLSITFYYFNLFQNVIFINPLIVTSLSSSYSRILVSNTQFKFNQQFSVLSSSSITLLYPDSCASYLKSAFTYTNPTQTCQLQIGINTIFNNIILYNEINYVFYDSVLNTTFQAATNLYSFPTINYDQVVVLSSVYSWNSTVSLSIYNQLSYSNQQSFAQCYFSLLNNSLTSTTTYTTSILYLSGIPQSAKVTVVSMSIQSNLCLGCYYGLLSITNINSQTPSSINISNVNCQSNVIGYYGCLSFTAATILGDATSSLPLIDYPVLNLSANRRLDIISDLQTQSQSIIIDSAAFLSNRAKVGAAVSIIGLNSLIMRSTFQNNYASLIGGSIFYQATSAQQLWMYSNTFQGNQAQIAGAVFLSSASLPSSKSLIIFSGNDASKRASNTEQTPTKLTLIMTSSHMKTTTYLNKTGDLDNDGFIDNTTATITDIISLSPYSIGPIQNTTYLYLPSGQSISSSKYYYSYTSEQVPFEWIFRVVNLDQFNEPMSNIDSTQTCSISGRMMDANNYDDTKAFLSNYTSQSSYFYNTSVGAYVLDNLIVTFDPYLASNLYLQLRFQCSSVQIPVFNTSSPYAFIGHNTQYSLYVNVQTFPCQLGEAYFSQQCKACSGADGTYSVQIKQTACSTIDSATMTSVSAVSIQLQSSYWRPTFDSSIIAYCINLPLNCNGGWIAGDPSCYTGHIGALCESCDIYNLRGDSSYSTSAKYTCGACANTTTVNSIVITALSLFTLISMILSVKGNYQVLEDYVRNIRLKSMGILISQDSDNLATLIKLFTNYTQIVSAITSFQISIPTSVTNTATVVGNPTQSMAYSLDCFLVGLTDIDILYFRMIWALLMPLLYLSIFFIGLAVGIIIKKVPSRISIVYTVFIYMFIYLQPTLVGGFISLASSRYVSGVAYVQADVSYEYYTDTHQVWLVTFVLPLLLIWGIVLPCLFLRLVYAIRNNLNDVENRRRLGYFYNEYTQDGYFWEFVKIFEKEFIIILLIYYQDQIVIKGLVIFLVVFFYGGFTIKYQPYSSKRLNMIDRLSTAVCGASLVLGVLIYAAESANLSYLTILMFIIISLLNGGFILLMMFYLFEGYIIKFQEKLDIIRDKIRIYYPQIQDEYPWLRRHLINHSKMALKVKAYWANLRYAVRQGIKRRRADPACQFFESKKGFESPVLAPFDFERQRLASCKLFTFNPANTIQGEASPGPLRYSSGNARVHPIDTVQDSPLELQEIGH